MNAHLPDRDILLEAVHKFDKHGEGLAAMCGVNIDDNSRIAHGHTTDAVTHAC
jgi:hypothetical protein